MFDNLKIGSIPPEVVEKILEAVRQTRAGCKRAVLKRRLLTQRHCGQPMAVVRVYYPEGQDEKQAMDSHVCVNPSCLFAEVPSGED